MSSLVVKCALDAFSPLLDHKEHVENCIHTFVQQFEGSQPNRDIESLFRTGELVTELKDSNIPKIQNLSEIHFPQLRSELQVAETIFDKLLSKRSQAETKSCQRLAEGRQLRAQEWVSFVDHVSEKMKVVDKNFEQKETSIKEQYANSEKFLETPNHTS